MSVTKTCNMVHTNARCLNPFFEPVRGSSKGIFWIVFVCYNQKWSKYVLVCAYVHFSN